MSKRQNDTQGRTRIGQQSSTSDGAGMGPNETSMWSVPVVNSTLLFFDEKNGFKWSGVRNGLSIINGIHEEYNCCLFDNYAGAFRNRAPISPAYRIGSLIEGSYDF